LSRGGSRTPFRVGHRAALFTATAWFMVVQSACTQPARTGSPRAGTTQSGAGPATAQSATHAATGPSGGSGISHEPAVDASQSKSGAARSSAAPSDGAPPSATPPPASPQLVRLLAGEGDDGVFWVAERGDPLLADDVLIMPDGHYITHLHERPASSGKWWVTGDALILDHWLGDQVLTVMSLDVDETRLRGVVRGKPVVLRRLAEGQER
jgi:hypothetical protein